MGCVKLHILDEQYKRTELKVSYFNKELTLNNSAGNACRCMLVRFADPDGKDWKDKVIGVVVGVATNVIPLSTGLRNLYSPNDASDYNNTLQAVDNTTIVVGTALIIDGGIDIAAGQATAAAGAAITVGTAGLGSEVGVPVAAAGEVLSGVGVAKAAAGAITLFNGANNASKGYNYGDNASGGKGSNHLKPDPNAQGDHSTFRTGSDGKTTNTATYKQNPKNPKTGFDEVKRVDVKGGSHKNGSGQEVSTPHVHEKGQKYPRPARPDELPKQ
jgi:hypothetical protein